MLMWVYTACRSTQDQVTRQCRLSGFVHWVTVHAMAVVVNKRRPSISMARETRRFRSRWDLWA